MAKEIRSYHDDLLKRLRADENLQIEHLKAAAEDAELNREHLYRLLSKDGNPKFDSLFKILNALGIEMTFQKKSKVS